MSRVKSTRDEIVYACYHRQTGSEMNAFQQSDAVSDIVRNFHSPSEDIKRIHIFSPDPRLTLSKNISNVQVDIGAKEKCKRTSNSTVRLETVVFQH